MMPPADRLHLEHLARLESSAAPSNLADVLEEAVRTASRIVDPRAQQLAQLSLHKLRSIASQADSGWILTSNPPAVPAPLQDIQVIQLVGIISALHELCYGFEMVDASSAIGWGGSGSTRFYLNSIYHYVSSLFLLDRSEPSHKGMPMGGTVIMALHPMGVSYVLDPVREVLDRSFGSKLTFGDTILRLRHSYLVHGTFSPTKIEYLVAQTEMRSLAQQLEFSNLAWDLFHQIMILRLRLVALLTATGIEVHQVVVRYMLALLRPKRS